MIVGLGRVDGSRHCKGLRSRAIGTGNRNGDGNGGGKENGDANGDANGNGNGNGNGP
jgi:hypothetical protein